MSVADIERRQGIDRARQRCDGRFVINHPKLVAHAVVGGGVNVGRALGRACQQGIDLRGGGIGQHDRAGLRIDRLDLANAVVFLDGGRVLVLADTVAVVVGNGGDCGKPGLRAVAPGQAVDVIAGLGVADQNAGRGHALEVFGRLGVDGAIIGVDGGIKVDLGLRNMQEAPRLVLRARARLRAREYVIGRRQDFAGASRCRTQRPEGFYERQAASPRRDIRAMR